MTSAEFALRYLKFLSRSSMNSGAVSLTDFGGIFIKISEVLVKIIDEQWSSFPQNH
jgi:hypothetical protein